MRRERLWLCVAPIVLYLLDNSLTLLGQPADYWDNYSRYSEFNPVAAWALEWHPIVFVIESLIWMVTFCLLIVILPNRLAQVLSLALTMGNATGSGHWLTSWVGYWAYPVLFLSTAALVIWTWEMAATNRTAIDKIEAQRG
jgi:hypothetical protein